MATKIKKSESQDVVFTDATKHKRAVGILTLINEGHATPHLKGEYSPEGQDDLVQKFQALLKVAKIDPKAEEALLFVYKKLGGGVTTYERQRKIKAFMKKNADSKAASEDAGGESSEDDEDGAKPDKEVESEKDSDEDE